MGRHVLVVEDIVDSGLTLNYLRRYLLARQPASLEVCALLVKEGQQRIDARPALRRLPIPPDFVVGYGLDVAERYRNLAGDPRATPGRSDSRGRTRWATGERRHGTHRAAVLEILVAIGEDPDRDGLRETPRPGGRDVRGAVRRASTRTRPTTSRSPSPPSTTRW